MLFADCVRRQFTFVRSQVGASWALVARDSFVHSDTPRIELMQAFRHAGKSGAMSSGARGVVPHNQTMQSSSNFVMVLPCERAWRVKGSICEVLIVGQL